MPNASELNVRIPQDRIPGAPGYKRSTDEVDRTAHAVSSGLAARVYEGRLYFAPVDQCRGAGMVWGWSLPDPLFVSRSQSYPEGEHEDVVAHNLDELLESGDYGRVVEIEEVYLAAFFDDKCSVIDDETSEWYELSVSMKEHYSSPSSLHEAPGHDIWRRCEDAILDEASDKLSDPLFDPEDEEEPISYLCGSEEELERISKAALKAHPEQFLGVDGPVTVAFETTSEESGRGGVVLGNLPYWNSMAFDDGDLQWSFEILGAVQDLLELAFEANTPCGFGYMYNDGAHRRRSGYMRTPKQVTIRSACPSDQDVIEAREEINAWLEETQTDKVQKQHGFH